MTKTIKLLTILTIVLNFFIIIFAGHGIGFLGLIEIVWMRFSYGIGTEDFSISLLDSYDKTLGFTAILSLIGQITLLLYIFLKKKFLIFVGLGFLWIGFIYLVHDLFSENDYIGTSPSFYSFLFGIPFLISSMFLFIKSKNPSKI